jgi:tetratricopeptide (TPR) repeat protein
MARQPTAAIRIGMVPSPADGFVPRPEIGSALTQALVPGTAVVLVSAHAEADAGGRAGEDNWHDPSGKTQLAAAAARSLSDSGEIEILVWVAATTRAAVLSAYAEAGAAIEGQSSGNAETAAERFVSWLRETRRPWLVVLDDLNAAAVPESLRPRGPAGRMLMTATSSAGLPGGGATPVVIPVGVFSRREALDYLTGRLKADVDQRQGAADLVGELGDEPLALAQAAAVIGSSDLTCHDYQDLIAGARRNIVGDDTSAAAMTWALSVEHADLLSPADADVQPLLVRAALLDGDGIPATVLQAPDELDALAQAALLTVDESTSPPLVRLNRVTQAAVRYAMPDGMLATAATSAADALVAAWPGSDEPEWLARGLRASADTLRRVAGDALWHGDGCHEVLLRAGYSLDAARLPGAAVEYWETLTADGERNLGPAHPGVLTIRERLARAHLQAGRTRESIDWFEGIRSGRARNLGPYAAATAEASHDLGRALLTAGKPRDAVGVLTDAVGGYERACGPASVEALTTREDLAAAQLAAGQSEDAIVSYRRTLADRERMQGKRHPDTMATCRRLADTYVAAGHPKSALPLYKRLLNDTERVLGPAHPDSSAVREALAAAQYATGRLASAISLYEQARANRTQTLGEDHELTLTTSVNLAHAYAAASRPTDAVNLLRDTVRRCELTRPAADPLAQVARESLANLTG